MPVETGIQRFLKLLASESSGMTNKFYCEFLRTAVLIPHTLILWNSTAYLTLQMVAGLGSFDRFG